MGVSKSLDQDTLLLATKPPKSSKSAKHLKNTVAGIINDQRKTPLSTNGSLLPPDYRPNEKEEFMNPLQREYFRRKLLTWRADLISESGQTLAHLQNVSLAEPDMNDRATLETDHAIELRTRDRERKLINKIDEALARIEDGSYGYCEETGEPISLRRLEARPIALYSLEAQERHERMEKTHRED